jgi:hypothetical protein
MRITTTMRTDRLLILAFALAAPAGLCAVGNDVPQPFPPDRYSKMIEKSPFAPATPVAAEDAPNFAQNLYITGIAKLGAQDCVFVASRDGQTRYSLITGEEGPQGMKIERITYSTEVGKTKVIIRKGGETGTVQFDQAAIQHTAAPSAPQIPGNPQIGIPRPPGQPQVAPARPQQPGGGSPVESRRRIRIINSRP